MNASRLEIPSIDDTDLKWAAALMKLPEHAFLGRNGRDPRREVFKSRSSMDVEACPGSGKTTLLVAKLAVLATKWKPLRQGVCVLSHTNVARCEIEDRLGKTAAGGKLLAYPHFVGTIHKFVNEFIALPWLRSKGISVRAIDDEITLNYRWFQLSSATRAGLEKNYHTKQIMRVRSTKFDLGEIRWGKKSALGPETPTYKSISEICRNSTREGFFCHDEMLLWASEAISDQNNTKTALRRRFPVLFIDEVQDNSNDQTVLLADLFTEGPSPVICQRFGDTNQGIYDSDSQADAKISGGFPLPRIRKDIPNSHRFVQEIAEVADPLAVVPQKLKGIDAKLLDKNMTKHRCVMFLFEEDKIEFVLKNYAQYLIKTFPSEMLIEGSFTAIGAIHKHEKDDKIPRKVGSYWPDYRIEKPQGKPRMDSAVQYLNDCLEVSIENSSSQIVVNAVAEIILHCTSLADKSFESQKRGRAHVSLLQILAERGIDFDDYRSLLTRIVERKKIVSETEWTDPISKDVSRIASTIIGKDVSSVVRDFLDWSANPSSGLESVSRKAGFLNQYLYPPNNPKVKIRLESIHSVKGENHSSTLVLETFYRTHNLKKLKKWLLGKKSGRGTENNATQYRLKQHYVAMTRPRHLLCLAMREDSFTVKELESLKSRWKVVKVTKSGPEDY